MKHYIKNLIVKKTFFIIRLKFGRVFSTFYEIDEYFNFTHFRKFTGVQIYGI